VISKRVDEISKLETNLEQRVNSKFLKYQKIIKEKESKLKEEQLLKSPKLLSDTIKLYDYEFTSQSRNFFFDWLVIDSIDSKNGPSNWVLKKLDSNKKESKETDTSILIQTSSIYVNNQITQSSIEIASSILLKNSNQKQNLYTSVKFNSKSYGSIQINFRYVDYNNFLALQLIRKSSDSGSIKLLKKLNGKISEIEDLPCDRMLSVMKKCFGYNTDEEENLVEIFNYEKSIQVLFNKNMIFNVKEQEINKFKKSKFSISINNQPELQIKDIVYREMNSDEILAFKEGSAKIKTNKLGDFKNRNMNKINENQNINKIIKSNNNSFIKKVKKYNPYTNNFEEVEDKGHGLNKKISSRIPISNRGINSETPLALMNKFRKNYVKEKCLKYEKEEYVCNYISNVITKNSVDIHSSTSEEISSLIRNDCITTMKNKLICEQILIKLDPVRKKI
jgi:hypothetical protein